MFSANENMALRQHKRRIIQYVEETMPEDLLDLGVTVLVMQVSCRAPGCVPLETVITIIFPPSTQELLPGLPESKNSGKFTTKVLLPMSDITKEDVLEALPPAFEGGRQSMERLCLRARDVMLAQITQLCTSLESKRFMAQYLEECLGEFTKNDFEAPEYGEPFPTKDNKIDITETYVEQLSDKTENIAIGRPSDKDKDDITKEDPKPELKQDAPFILSSSSNTKTIPSRSYGSAPLSKQEQMRPSANDWRRQQSVERTFNSDSLLSRVSKMEHAPGMRTPGCPCCDPDDPQNFADSMAML